MGKDRSISDDNSGPGQSQSTPDHLTLIAFAAFVLLAGGAAIAVRMSYAELAPYWSGAVRFGLAALIFWALVLVRRVPLPRGKALVGAALFGFLSVGAAFLLVYYGLTKTPASLYSILVAIVPLLTLFFAAAHKLERLQLRGVFGGLLAMAGIAIAASGSLSSGVEISLPHIAAILLGAVCFAEAGIVIKLFPHSHPYATNAVAMTVGTSMLAIASLLLEETWTIPSQPVTWFVMIYLVVGTAGAFLLYLFILDRWTASGTAYTFVLVPIVTVILASFLTDETISLIFLAGTAVVLAGVYVGALMPTKTKDPVEEVVPTATSELAMEHIHARPGTPTCT